MDRDGRTNSLRAAQANWTNLLFAPDGRRLAMQIFEGTRSDIWIYEWARDTLSRLTFDPATDQKPVWTPDGRRVTFGSTRADPATPNLYWQRADGTGDTVRLTESRHPQQPGSWHPSGRSLVFEEQSPQTGYDLMILPMEGTEASGWKPGTPTVYLSSPFAEREPMFSPDGRWLAYVSNESGSDEVYVRPFPVAGGKWQVSTGGGDFPTWSRTANELFYGLAGQVMVTTYTADDDAFRSDKPRLWVKGRVQGRGLNRMFDLHPDGTRVALALVEEAPGVKQDKLTFLFNVFDELRRIGTVEKP
jgi:serine/threonine-protein kinase